MTARNPATPDPTALGTLSETIAREAGGLLLDGFQGLRTVETKTSPTDVVTEMDRASEALIVQRILAARPDDGLLGEEGAAREGTTGVRWIIDPLDGTVNYLYRRPDFAVCIAAQANGVEVAAAVFAPAHDEMFLAVAGQGATLNGHPIGVSAQDRLPLALCGTGFGYEAETRRIQGTILARVIGEIGDIRRRGSAALALCAVACGRLDTYYERGVQAWDVSAAGLIVRESGGHAEPLEGAPLTYEKTWIAGNRALFADFRALIGGASGLDTPPRC